jgi:hypothetical protein
MQSNAYSQVIIKGEICEVLENDKIQITPIFDETFESSFGVYNLQSSQLSGVQFVMKEINSIFKGQSFNDTFNKIFDIEFSVSKINFIQTSEANRSILIGTSLKVEDNPGINYISMTYTTNTASNQKLFIHFNDELVIRGLVFWMYYDIIEKNLLNDFSVEEVKEILSQVSAYFLNVVRSYLLSLATYQIGIDIDSYDISFSIDRKLTEASDLHDLYKKQVNCGYIVPLTPIHNLFYLNLIELDKWIMYAFTSCLIVPDLFKSIDSILPCFNSSSKKDLSLLIVDKLSRNVDYYTFGANVLKGFETNDHFTCEEIITELLIKSFMLNGHNVDMLFITDGRLDQNDRKSPIIPVPYINSYFCKFKLKDLQQIIVLIEELLMVEKSTIPVGFKYATRLVDRMPRLVERFLEE